MCSKHIQKALDTTLSYSSFKRKAFYLRLARREALRFLRVLLRCLRFLRIVMLLRRAIFIF